MKLRGDRCLCRACGEHFNSTYAFNRHRVGSYAPLGRRCRTVEEMLALGMLQNEAGWWITSAKGVSSLAYDSTGGDQENPAPARGQA